MGQITHGLRSILSHPIVYSTFQSLMGPKNFRPKFVQDFIKPFPNMRILDIGCGPADILAYLPMVEYYGFDISEKYIKCAEKKFGDKGTFYAHELTGKNLTELPSFDVVLGLGILHHLDDAEVANFLNLAYQALKPGGRLITLDCCFDESQNLISKFLVKQDRGQNVRNLSGYTRLAHMVFNQIHAKVQHQKWIPYTHCIMECTS